MNLVVVTNGIVSQGKPLDPKQEDIVLPESILSETEVVYRVGEGLPDAIDGDLLVVEPRNRAATGELVLVEQGRNLYVGRWWQKHGRRDVLGPNQEVVVSKPTIIGAINLIVRGVHG